MSGEDSIGGKVMSAVLIIVSALFTLLFGAMVVSEIRFQQMTEQVMAVVCILFLGSLVAFIGSVVVWVWG